ncbi:VanZ family protein [Streptomyces inhibens]|uniref:VanZ family protein n=1 Tax=Streptomyces inhibens TaxID=2293571 RepID=A0A371Q6X0_STRIH|nr:VanZ family protein [Streptomyces inhibens]REK90143.1 VanZ family protein [Streptomyces inhibens]
MIEASISALPGLVSLFVVATVLLGLPAALIAGAKKKSIVLSLLFAATLAGILTVTMTPGSRGVGQARVCDAGLPLGAFLASESAQLNFLLFVPVSVTATLLFRRPISVAVGSVVLAFSIELAQAWLAEGRACTYDDITANAIGGVGGVLCTTVYLWVKERQAPFTLRDILWGTGLAAVTGAALTAAFHFSITTVDGDARQNQAQQKFRDTDQQDQWMNRTVVKIYGQQTEVTETGMQELGHGRWRLTAKTARGEISALWPDRKLESVWSKNNKDDGGNLTDVEMKAAAERFGKEWFPDETAGSRTNFRAVAEQRGAHLLNYRRYVHGVMMPMRVDIIVTTSGRIMGVTAQTTADPSLPKATVTKKEAKKLAEQASDRTEADPVSLLARRVSGSWRPVWMIGLKAHGSDENTETMFLDAVTGKRVQPQNSEAPLPGQTGKANL